MSWSDAENTSFLIDVWDTSEDMWMPLQLDTGYSKPTYNHTGLEPDGDTDNDDYFYRVFAYRNGVYDGVMGIGGTTKQATIPDPVRGLDASSDSPTMIKLEWDKPAEDGGQPITGYRIEIGSDASWPRNTTDSTTVTRETTTPDDVNCPTLAAGVICVREVKGADTLEFTLGKLKAGTDRWFRVFAINKVNSSAVPNAEEIGQATPEMGTSLAAGTPGTPLDITVQPARDANTDDPSELGIDILWNAPGDPAGDEVTGYVIARRVKASTDDDWGDWDEEWQEITDDSPDFLRTHDTDGAHPDIDGGEMREYRVQAKSGAGAGPWTDVVVYPVDTSHDPIAEPEVGAATGVTTGPFNEGGVIQVNWDAAPNATGYIIYAVNVDELDQDDGQVVVAPVNDAAAETFNLGGLNSGDTYDIYVVATAKEMVAWPDSADVVQVAAN